MEWEYLTVTVNGYLNDRELNELGKAPGGGWELAAAYAIYSHVRFIFKRPIRKAD